MKIGWQTQNTWCKSASYMKFWSLLSPASEIIVRIHPVIYNSSVNALLLLLLLLLLLYGLFWGLGRLFRFFILYTVGRTHLTRDQPVARPLPTHRTTQTQNKRTQTSMPWVRFEPRIPALKRAKTVHALDRAAIVICECQCVCIVNWIGREIFISFQLTLCIY
jgi:hypothetical protein